MGVLLDTRVLYDVDLVDPTDSTDLHPNGQGSLEDAALVAQARAGQFEAFEELVHRYRNDVFRVAYHFVRNREDAWDASQEVFLRAYRGLARFRGEVSFKNWVLRITSNYCKDFFKKRRLRTVSLDDGVDIERHRGRSAGPRERAAAHEIGEAISAAVDALPQKHRAAFVLREFEGLSYKEMADVMGCSLGTVMSRLHHARKKLQRALAAIEATEGTP